MNSNQTFSDVSSHPSQVTGSDKKSGSNIRVSTFKPPKIVMEQSRGTPTDGSETSKPNKTFNRKQGSGRNVPRPQRIQTTGEKQSQAQIDELGTEQDYPSGSVNIQTDAISFEKTNAVDQNSATTGNRTYKKQKSQVSFKTKSSIRSGGVPIPPAITRQSQFSRKDSKPDTLNISLLQGEHQHEVINRRIQRDLRQTANSSMAEQLMPPHGQKQSETTINDSHGLLIPKPFVVPLMKQTTGRNDKEKFKNASMPGESITTGLLLMPNFVFQRGLTKQEERPDQDRETLDAKLAVTSIKSITRPSNVSGMASALSPSSQRGRDDDEDNSVLEEYDHMQKPSVQVHIGFGNNGDRSITEDATVISGPPSSIKNEKGATADSKSGKSFKTKDENIMVEVETQIQILDQKKKNDISPQQTMTEKKKYLADTNKKEKVDKTLTKSKGPMSISSQGSLNQHSRASQQSAFQKQKQKQTRPTGAKSFVPPVSQSKLLSSRAQRDAMSDKGGGGQIAIEPKSDSPLNSPKLGISVTSVGDGKSGLRSIQGGLVSIQEQQDEQPDAMTTIKSPQAMATGPVNLNQSPKDSSKPQRKKEATNSQKEEVSDKVSVSKSDAYGAVMTDLQGKSKPKGRTGQKKTSDKSKSKQQQEEKAPEKYVPHTLMKHQIYAYDFFEAMTGQRTDDPEQVAEFVGQNDDEENKASIKESESEPVAPPPKHSRFARYRTSGKHKSTKFKGQQSAFQAGSSPTEDGAAKAQMSSQQLNAMRRMNVIIQNNEVELLQKIGSEDRVKELEDQVAKLKEVIELQRTKQQILEQVNQIQASNVPDGRRNEVRNNKGFIQTVNQPTYNFTFIQGVQDQRPNSDGGADPIADFLSESNQPGYRPRSSNINRGRRPSAAQVQSQRRQRPMTASHEAKRVQKAQQFEVHQQRHLQQQPSSIDFHLASRPISAATQQKQRGMRNQHNQLMATDGQVSDYRYQQERKLSKFLDNVQTNTREVPSVGHVPYDKQLEVRDTIAVRQLLQDGHFFHPVTNMGTEEGVKRTQSCYMNVFSSHATKAVQPNTNYLRTNAGKTGYVSIPNKSQKILEKAYVEEPQTLSKQQPLGHSTEPMRSLKGPLLTEMISFHKQKNRNKHGYVNRKNQKKETISRHTRLKQAVRKSKHANEDLFFSPIDDYMREHLSQREQTETPESSDSQSQNSRTSIPGLTGNTHIMMERDLMEDKYELEQNGRKIKLGETHFQPIFFAKDTNELRDNPTAQKALKQYRIFVRPDEVHEQLKNKAPIMDPAIQKSLETRIADKVKEDIENFKKLKAKMSQPQLQKFDRMQEGRTSQNSYRSSVSQMAKDSARFTQQKKKDRARKASGSNQLKKMSNSERRLMLYRMRQQSSSNLKQTMLDRPLANQMSFTKKDLQSPTPLSSKKKSLLSSPLYRESEGDKKKVPPPLNDKMNALVNRLSQGMEPRTREPIRQSNQNINRQLSQVKQGSPKRSTIKSKVNLQKNAAQASPNSFASSGSPPSSENESSMQMMSRQSPPQTATAKQLQLTKMKMSQSTDRSGPGMANQFRPFSASTGGGAYPSRSTQENAKRPEALKKSQTPTAAQLTSNSSYRRKEQETGLERATSKSTTPNPTIPSSRPKQNKSVLSAEQKSLLPKAQSRQKASNLPKATSSSDKFTNKSMSQKTGTATERKTDGTANKTMTKNFDSKFSETHTNIESDITEKTQIVGSLPQNINCLQVVVPSLSHRLQNDSALMKSESEDDALRLKKSDLSEGAARRKPDQPDIMLVKEEDSRAENPPNIEVSVTPLDETAPALNLHQQMALVNASVSPKSKQTEQLDDDNELIHGQTFGKKELRQLNLRPGQSSEHDSKMHFQIEDSLSHSSEQELRDLLNEDFMPSVKSKFARTANMLNKDITAVQQTPEKPEDETSETPDLGKSEHSKVPTLLINSLEKIISRRESVEEGKQKQSKDTLLKIQTSKNPNTDRNVRKDTLNAHSSRQASRQEEQYLDLPGEALNVPMSSWQRGKLHKLKVRQMTKDSQSSVLTPIFPKDQKHRGGSPSAQSASSFSFAADLNRREMLGEFKNSQGSSQSRKRLAPNKSKKNTADSHISSQIEDLQESENSSVFRQRLMGENIDLQELKNDGDLVDATPKSATVVVLPIFQVVEKP